MDDRRKMVTGEDKPHIGIEFDSEEGARVFYNNYVKSKGFGTFKGPV